MLEGSLRSNLLLSLPAIVLAVLLVSLTGALSPSFLTEANLANVATRLLPLGLVALGQAIVLFAGRIDLSVGTIMSVSTAIMALTSASLGWSSIPLTILAGIACGLFTAAGVIVLRINPLVMSLATAAIVKGLTLLVLPSPGGEVDYALYELFFESESVLGPPLLLCLATYLVLAIVMGWSRLGRSVYAFGSDARSAFANGVSGARVDIAVYGIAGGLAALAGIFLSIRILSGDPLIGEAYTLDSVSAAILGGVALQGGRGNVVGVFFAALALVLVNNMFNLLGLDTNLQAIVKGLIFVGALVFFMRGKQGEA
jgi:ribose transport system permease protein